MIVNKEIIQEIYDEAGQDRVERAEQYIKQSRVEIKSCSYANEKNFNIEGNVEGNYDNYKTIINVINGEIDEIFCECPDYAQRGEACKHIVATLMKFEQSKFWEKTYKGEGAETVDNIQEKLHRLDPKFFDFRQIVDILYDEEIQSIEERADSDNVVTESKQKVKIEPKMLYDDYEKILKLEFKLGINQMYKLQDISEFYTRMNSQEFYRYGNKLKFIHSRENFTDDSQDLLDIILSCGEVFDYAQQENRYTYFGGRINHKYIILRGQLFDKAFDALKNRLVPFEKNKRSGFIDLVEKNPNIKFILTKQENGEYTIKPNKDIFDIQIFRGKDYVYILEKKTLYKCTEEFTNTTIRLINLCKQLYTQQLNLNQSDLKDLSTIVMPKLGNCIELKNVDKAEIEKYKPQKLAVKMYLDFDEKENIIADVKFCYEEKEFNPIDNDDYINDIRDNIEEIKIFNIFNKTGFMIDGEHQRLILPEEEKIFNFLANDIEFYMQKFEVLVTDNFKSKEIQTPKLGNMGVKVENNLLSIDLSKINVDISELQNIMKKYQLKKKYHRLKDGSFLNLENNENIEFLDELVTGMDLDYEDLNKDVIKLPVNRSIYLNELLKRNQITNVTKDKEFKKIINDLDQNSISDEIKIPKNMENVLRDYQEMGFKWLRVLDSYHFGGILADDMGLGKTLQILTVIEDYIKGKEKNKRASLVVAPSSLALNWLAETKKFTPEINATIIKGIASEREQLISKIDNYDLIITSYDLLKRDINLYEEKGYVFRYIIADEAQYMKNSKTQNAKAIKRINADTRFALTGTPIENSLSELWSIFDFIMPGYLFRYKKFKELYEKPIVKENDDKAMNKLKMLISPFILRRNKKDVLTELPEKTITVLNNQMTKEQEEIYISYLLQIKEEVTNEININGFEKSQIKILAGLTRLRQICCHPRLFIDNYKGGSSKLEQCMDIVEEAIQAGHKILLFSGYTSMFEIIEDELEKRQIKFFKLTGGTKVDERIELVDKFNSDSDIKIFLISLKAGGTGLNLTGADMVIHYDPWWNQAAENQATDRAYRIGQKNNVQVYKLITSNSIEDRIYEMQQRKASLIDNMLDINTSFINKLSKDEIMSLFE